MAKFFFHQIIFLTETGSLEEEGRKNTEQNDNFILLTLAKFTIVLTSYFK